MERSRVRFLLVFVLLAALCGCNTAKPPAPVESLLRPEKLGEMDSAILKDRFIHRLQICYGFLTRFLKLTHELRFVPIRILSNRRRVEYIEIIFFAFEFTVFRNRQNDDHTFIPPGKDMCQHIAETRIAHFLEAFFLFGFG